MALFDQRDPVERQWGGYGADAQAVAQPNLMNAVYQHMALGLGATGLTAMYASTSPALNELVAGHYMALVLLELGLVMGISMLINRINAATAAALFYLYAVTTGLTLSILFQVYTHASIASTFFVTAATFGTVSVYGYVTKRDLTGLGSFMMMGLIGIVIASVVNLFMHNSGIAFAVTYLGVPIFIGLTAYDTQRIKEYAAANYGQDSGKLAIIGALTLYLDFINLFLSLMKILGRRR